VLVSEVFSSKSGGQA